MTFNHIRCTFYVSITYGGKRKRKLCHIDFSWSVFVLLYDRFAYRILHAIWNPPPNELWIYHLVCCSIFRKSYWKFYGTPIYLRPFQFYIWLIRFMTNKELAHICVRDLFFCSCWHRFAQCILFSLFCLWFWFSLFTQRTTTSNLTEHILFSW